MTPTPGDLSARHAATLQTMIHQSDDGAICICAECRALKAAIAALSALPAAGGESVGSLTVRRYRGIDAMVNHEFDYFGNLPDGSYSVYTTPQPSAAEGECTNCGRSKRADRAIDACACASLTYTPPPDAVGAQWDGWAMTDAEIEQWIGACNYGKARDTLRHYLQLRSALTRQPVAGDGK